MRARIELACYGPEFDQSQHAKSVKTFIARVQLLKRQVGFGYLGFGSSGRRKFRASEKVNKISTFRAPCP